MNYSFFDHCHSVKMYSGFVYCHVTLLHKNNAFSYLLKEKNRLLITSLRRDVPCHFGM